MEEKYLASLRPSLNIWFLVFKLDQNQLDPKLLKSQKILGSPPENDHTAHSKVQRKCWRLNPICLCLRGLWWVGGQQERKEEGLGCRRVSKLESGSLTVAVVGMGIGYMEALGSGVETCNFQPVTGWLMEKKGKSPMTPTLLLPSREEPDGTKAPHCCPLTQDHQGHSSEGEGAGGGGVRTGLLWVGGGVV